MKKFRFLLFLSLFISAAWVITSCKTDDPVNLSVSPSEISLLSDKNSTATITITTNSDWMLSVDATWLTVSARSGNGTSTLTITALSENASASTREANITITAGGSQTKTVTVSQLGAFKEGCNVDFKDIVIMTNSVAFKFNIDPKVEYFTFGWLKSTAAGWTDERIVQWLADEDNAVYELASEAKNEIFGLDGMAEGTDYYLVAVAFDKNGNRGELTKKLVTTPKLSKFEPITNVDDVSVDANYWYWITYPNARVQRYYMISIDDNYASLYPIVYSEAELAAIIKELIDEDSLTPMSNSIQSWNMKRESSSLFIATWGQDVDGKFANTLFLGVWSINNESSARIDIERNVLVSPKITRMSFETKRSIQEQISIMR